MLSEKTNKGHSISSSQVTTTQQQPQQQQSDLQHLSLMIQQFSSQLNVMLSQQQKQQQQQQQQKHSDIGARDNTMDIKQEQPSYIEQLHCPANSSRHHPPLTCSSSNFCSNAVGSCSKININNNNNSEHHCHSTRLSPSLSTLFPVQHHYTSSCLHDTLYQNHYHHTPLLPHVYDTCTLPMTCCCHHPSPYQISATNTNTLFSPLAPTGNISFEQRPYQQHRNTMPTTPPKFKSRTDPLPPIPNNDNTDANTDDDDDDGKATMTMTATTAVEDQDDSPLNTGHASSPNTVSSILQQPFIMTDSSARQVSWTDIYRQDILAKQDTLISSYGDLDNIHITDNNHKKKENIPTSSRSHSRGWWKNGKYKWKQFRKKSVAPL